MLGKKLDPLPPPPLVPQVSGDPAASKTLATDEHMRRLLEDPLVLRAFRKEQKRREDGTWGMTDEQRRLGVKLGLDRKTLAEISVALAKLSTPARGGPSNASGPPLLTEAQKRAAARMGLADPDPKEIQTNAAMRSGAGFEIRFPRSAPA